MLDCSGHITGSSYSTPIPVSPPTPPPPFSPNGDVRDTDATASGHGRRGWNQRRTSSGAEEVTERLLLLVPSHRRLQRAPSAMINHRLSLDGSYLRLRTRSEEIRGERKRGGSPFERSSKLSLFLLVFLLQPSVNYLIVPFAGNFCLLSRV